MKICTSCNKEKDESEFYSVKRFSKKLGWYEALLSHCKECAKEKAKNWFKENKEKRLLIFYKHNRKEKAKEARRVYGRKKRESGEYKEWQKSNTDKLKEYGEKRKNKNHIISKREWLSCKKYFSDSCAYCGITYDEHKLKYNQDLHREHVTHDGSVYLDNCVPSCKICNSSKHIFKFEEWYVPSNPVYSDERKDKIIKWLNEDYKLYFEVFRDKGVPK